VSIEAVIETIKLLVLLTSLIVAVIGVWKTLAVVRIKIEAETRLKVTAEIESQIKLLELFARLMDVAHARSGYHFSEIIAKHLVDTGNSDYSSAIASFPVGIASQDAAISAIANLAIKHEILREPAIQGLESIKTFKPEMASKHLQRISQYS